MSRRRRGALQASKYITDNPIIHQSVWLHYISRLREASPSIFRHLQHQKSLTSPLDLELQKYHVFYSSHHFSDAHLLFIFFYHIRYFTKTDISLSRHLIKIPSLLDIFLAFPRGSTWLAFHLRRVFDNIITHLPTH